MFEKLEKTHLFSGKLYFCTFHKHCEFSNPVSATDIFMELVHWWRVVSGNDVNSEALSHKTSGKTLMRNHINNKFRGLGQVGGMLITCVWV